MNTYKRTTLLATGAVVMLLTGCAADPRLGLDGKAGYVTEYYSRDRLRNAPPRCLASLTSEQIATGTYAKSIFEPAVATDMSVLWCRRPSSQHCMIRSKSRPHPAKTGWCR
jgi:hypothetical protein